MEKIYTWIYIFIAVAIALLANTVATIWSQSEQKFSLWLLLLMLLSPVVFITFGLVTAKVGLVISSGTIDSLLTITTVLLALFAFGEWQTTSIMQYLGIAFTITGIICMHAFE